MEMEFICNDLDGVSPWHYDAEKKTYYRSYVDGKHNGKIKGEYIPPPHKLWQHRIMAVGMVKGQPANEIDKAQNKPSKTTFELFEHWQKVSENGDHNG